MPARHSTAFFLLALGCSSAREPPGGSSSDTGTATRRSELEPVVLPLKVETLLSESVAACEDAVVLSAWLLLCSDDDGAWLLDESIGSSSFLAEAGAVAGAVVDEALWVVLDGQPWLWDGDDRFALDLPVPVPIEVLRHEGGRLWMQGLGRLFSWSEESVSEWTLDGSPAVRDFASTGPRLHLTVPELVTLRLDDAGPVVESTWPHPISSLAAGGPDDLWFVSGGQLYRKQGSAEPLPVRTPAPAEQVVGPGPWVLGGGQSWRYADGGFHAAPLPVDAPLSVDHAGRLWTATDGTVTRHDPGRSVVVVGLPDALSLATDVTLLPTDPDSLDALSVWVDDQPLVVEERPLSVTLDPETLAPGEHVLRFFTKAIQGDHLSEQAVWVGELPRVEWPEISEINDQHCSACHGGATATDLSTPADWQRHIDDIIDLVTRGEMPLGEAPLSDDEIIAIRAWKHGGFP